MKRIIRVVCAFSVACAFGSFSARLQAQNYPTRPITIMLSYGAGGPTDLLARTLAERVSQRVGQPVLVNPKPGANERIARELRRDLASPG